VLRKRRNALPPIQKSPLNTLVGVKQLAIETEKG